MTSIGEGTFKDCDLLYVISKIKNPEGIPTNTFSDNTFFNATLYVPAGTIEKYKAKEGWKKFLFFEEGTGPGGETPETKKCAKPTISYSKGKLTFSCATEGATCQATITDEDIKTCSGNEVQLNVTYHISVYAKKAGYENSETTTATLCWIESNPMSEGLENGVASISANAVLIKSSGGVLIIQGAEEGADIRVYNTAGQLAGTAKASADITNINTSLRSGEVGIVKIDDKTIKVQVR